MKKNIVKITESELHNIVKESVNRILCEYDADKRKKEMDNDFRYMHNKIRANDDYTKYLLRKKENKNIRDNHKKEEYPF